jgi:hypothetical protein
MIGESIPERHEQARADLEASVAQFLTKGGKIHDCGGAASVPRRPNFRWYPDQQPQDKQVVQAQHSPPAARPGHPGGQDHDRQRS